MEPNESGLSSYYHHHHHHPPPPQPLQHHHQSLTTSSTSPTNGILSNAADRAPPPPPHMFSVPSAVETTVVRRKRGRPRKYGTPEQAAAAKRVPSSPPSSMPISQPKKKDHLGAAGASSTTSSSSKKSQLAAFGNVGQGFTPHIIAVDAGEDVAQRIMLFMQQSKREMCILSASGSISNPSLRQPATSGGNITYEGRYDILSLSGSYIRTNLGGRTGGLSVSLSSSHGQIIGGGVGGPMKAAGPVQVIVGTFSIDAKKYVASGVNEDVSASKTPSLVGGVTVFQSAGDSSGRIPFGGSDDHQIMGGSQFMIQPRGTAVTPSRSSEWRSGTNYELAGRTGHGGHQFPENGDYEPIQD